MIGPGNFFQFFCAFCKTKNAKLDPAASVASNTANFGCHHREVHWTCSYVASYKGLIGWRFAFWRKLFVTFLHKTPAICVRELISIVNWFIKRTQESILARCWMRHSSEPNCCQNRTQLQQSVHIHKQFRRYFIMLKYFTVEDRSQKPSSQLILPPLQMSFLHHLHPLQAELVSSNHLQNNTCHLIMLMHWPFDHLP